MKGKTHGLPAAGPDSVKQPLVPSVVVDGGPGVVGLIVVDAGLAVVGEGWTDSCKPLSSTNGSPRVTVLGCEISSIKHLERLPMLQSPHLQRYPIKCPCLAIY